ncbi:MAG TPA: hypothetical protein VGA64_08145 [Candidatus Polarisedimenticolia bacterium]
MSDTVDELLESMERAIAALKTRGETRYANDIDNLVRVKKVIQGLDPDEVDALLEDDEEE